MFFIFLAAYRIVISDFETDESGGYLDFGTTISFESSTNLNIIRSRFEFNRIIKYYGIKKAITEANLIYDFVCSTFKYRNALWLAC